jgi:hypothetical protein
MAETKSSEVVSIVIAVAALAISALTWYDERVHGEFLLMPRLAFGITHDNVSASDNISSLPAWVPELQ